MAELQFGPAWPGLDNRATIIGRTGSGKSVRGAHMLLRYRQAYHGFPWIIFNPKRDRLLDNIGAERLDLKKDLPSSGLAGRMVVFHPVPESDDDDDVNRLIVQAMYLGNTGLYFDEGYSVPSNSKPFRRALTQGRSENVPVIILSQRPVKVDRFAFSEASQLHIFDLTDASDKKRVGEFTGLKLQKIPDYESIWYDVSKDRQWRMAPGPTPREIVERFRAMVPKRKPFFRWS